jgi:hypothetical protein
LKINGLGLIEMEQTGPPGCWGDSAAESSRYVTLQTLLAQSTSNINLSLLVTPQGVVRYPSPPSPWAASDTSSDQVMPLLAATCLTQTPLNSIVIAQLTTSDYKTGNGQLINLTTYAQLKRCQGSKIQGLFDLSILGQALVSRLPFVWNTNATLNPSTWFISSYGSSADYLNWINALSFARQVNWTFPCYLATKVVSSNKAMSEIASYYQPEPNSQWLLDIYKEAIAKIWR